MEAPLHDRRHARSSTANVTIRPLTLDELAAQNGLPDDLLRVALLEQIPGGVVAEIADKIEKGDAASLAAAKKLSDDNLKLRDRIVLAAVVAPKLTARDLAGLDPFDKAEIAGFAQRRETVDAAGRRVGADALDTFRIVGEEHGCPPNCEACAASARRVFGLQ
jgi:hypothetical protein